MYARPDVPVAEMAVSEIGMVRLPVAGSPVAFRNLAVCDASEIVVVQALGLDLSCDAGGNGVTLVYLGGNAAELLTQFVAMLRRSGYAVQVTRTGVSVSGAGGQPGETVSAPLPVADMPRTISDAATMFTELGFAMRADVFSVPAQAVNSLGLAAKAVQLDGGGSIVLGDAASIELARSLFADAELASLHVSGTLPETFVSVLSELGLSVASDPQAGSVVVGRPRDLRAASGILAELVGRAENIRADIEFRRIERAASVGLVPGDVLTGGASFARAAALPTLVTRNGGRSSLSSTTSLPFTTSVVADGVVSEAVEYREAGFTASLEATGNADGAIDADLVVEISAFGAGDPPALTSQRFEVAASVTSGQTVLLGILDASDLSASASVGSERSAAAQSRETVLVAVATVRRLGPRGEDLFTPATPRVKHEVVQ